MTGIKPTAPSPSGISMPGWIEGEDEGAKQAKRSLFKSPHPGPLPEGEGVYRAAVGSTRIIL
jgi:hypothetical protein